MPRYAILMEYDGTNYAGYQIQPNGPTIQESLEKALTLIAKLPKGQHIHTSCSGRTDAGVHALGQVIHCDFPHDIPPQALLKALNSILDPSIRIRQISQVNKNFHCRYMAVGKEYLYRVDLGAFPNPFKRQYTLHHPYHTDVSRIQKAAKSVIGTHDFTSFCSTKTDKTDLVRTITSIEVWIDQANNELCFRFQGNGFLYNMVRILVGTLLQIGDGLKPINELERLIQLKDRKEAGPTAPPQGLYMVKVYYEDEENPFE